MTREQVEDDLSEAFATGDWLRAEELQAFLDEEDRPPVLVSPLAVALWYAERGLHVFPCRPGAKVPFAGSRGVHEATDDALQIATWWTAEPDANVAIATGHLIDVVDFDGERAHAAWGQRFASEEGRLDVLGSVSTPRPGGLHLYVPASGHGNRAAMAPGVDYRGAGGYVLAPPSVIGVGVYPGVYRFLRPLMLGS